MRSARRLTAFAAAALLAAVPGCADIGGASRIRGAVACVSPSSGHSPASP